MLTKYYDRNNTIESNLFDPFYLFSDFAWPGHRSHTSTKTRYDVTTDEDGLTLTVDLPGVKKEDVKIESADKLVTIKSKRGTEVSSMSYRISKDYDIDSADANLEHGVLTLKFCKTKTSNVKTIHVK